MLKALPPRRDYRVLVRFAKSPTWHKGRSKFIGFKPNKPLAAVIERGFWIGAPAAPDYTWDCGTDVVWPVVDEEFLSEVGLSGERIYVCRHQIEIGD